MLRSLDKWRWQLTFFVQTATRDLRRPVTSKLRQAWTETGGCVFPGWVLIFSCLPSTLSSHSSLTYSFHGSLPWPHSPASDLLKRKKREVLQTDREAARPELTPFCPSPSISSLHPQQLTWKGQPNNTDIVSHLHKDNECRRQRILPFQREHKTVHSSGNNVWRSAGGVT